MQVAGCLATASHTHAPELPHLDGFVNRLQRHEAEGCPLATGNGDQPGV